MKTVFITGISRGIGEALAREFLEAGWRVVGTSVNGGSPCVHDNLTVHRLDLSDPESIKACAEKISGDGVKVDILINNAGVLLDNDDIKLDTEKLLETLGVNLVGTADFTEKILPLMNPEGHIVFVSSQAGSLSDIRNFEHSHAPFRYPAYKISKAALNMYSRTLALRMEHENSKIIVSAVHPGWVKTDMGGDEAPTTPQEAAKDIYELAISKPENGQFWYKGEKFPW